MGADAGDSPPRTCPRCRVPLHQARGASMVVDVCTTCGGAFFDLGELARLIAQHPEQLGALDALSKSQTPPLDEKQQREMIHCPACQTGMEAYRYAGCTNVWLHECPQCNGAWADDGELQAVEAHVERARSDLGARVEQPRPVLGDSLDLTGARWSALDLVGFFLLGRRGLF